MSTARTGADTWLMAGRNLRRLPRAPEQIGGAIAQPVMFTLLFTYVFGAAIAVPGGGSYPQYLLPGIMVQVMAFASIGTAAGVAEDMASGIVDRFRSLPIARSAVLGGRALSDLVQRAGQLAVLAGLGLAVGWRAHHDLAHTLAAFGLLLLFGLAFAWVGTWIGLTARNVEATNNFGLLWLFPVTFIASTFVPLTGMPTWLRGVAEWNPVSAMVGACRQLFGDPTTPSHAWPLTHPVIAAVAWSALLIAVFAPLAVRRYQTMARR
jgi:ABC transporter DrrB family efflux protein